MYVAAEAVGECGSRDGTLVDTSPGGSFVSGSGNEMAAIGDEAGGYLGVGNAG